VCLSRIMDEHCLQVRHATVDVGYLDLTAAIHAQARVHE